MSTLVWRNAKILLDGLEMAAVVNEGPGISYSAEMLDETAHGDDTRINKGGLLTASVDVGGHCEFGSGSVEEVLFDRVGDDDVPIVVFPNGITEGTQCGFALLASVESLQIGGGVGSLLPFSLSAQSRGLVPA